MVASTPSININLRPAILAVLLCAQVLLVSLGYDAYQVAIISGGGWFSFVSQAGQFAKILIAALAFLIMGLWPRLRHHLEDLIDTAVSHKYQRYLVAQLASFALFVWCTSVIFEPGVGVSTIPDVLVVTWLVTLITTAVLWILALAPIYYWLKLLSTEREIFAYALVAGISTWWLTLKTQALWTPLSNMTFQVSAGLLNLLYEDIVVDAATKQLGVKDFVVNIAPQCSGYEGIALITMFTGFYLSIFRRDFRFPQALLLLPIGIVTIWLFNNLRIALLIAIGASFSPAVAVGGFHSQAGWISFILVSASTLMLAYRIPFFSGARKSRAVAQQRINLPMATLIPFIVLLAATILTSALSAGFDWLYPLRVLAVAAAIGVGWRIYGLTMSNVGIEAWVAGAMVFVVWIILVPVDPAANDTFVTQLQSGSTTAAVAWLLFRMLGAVITVPIAEELLFRGYLMSRLARQEVILGGRIQFSWIPFIASSLMFGLLHSNWIAGITAGLIYGLVRYRSKGIENAIVAHGFTNLLLTVYVLSTGSWSLW
jgi:exosortase E/protease (VPEID-CTERM system)